MTDPHAYARHTRITNPGRMAGALRAYPTDPAELSATIRRLTAHYRATPGIPDDRLGEPDTRWIADILAQLHAGRRAPLTQDRPLEERFVGCCRDDALLFVAALREHGVPARSRVGFAHYFRPDFQHDHVIAEFWSGERWVRVDPELDPAHFPFNPLDLPEGVFETAAQVWRAYRAGRTDATTYGVAPDAPDFLRGPGLVRAYVIRELAALTGWELLLWDDWGLIGTPLADLTDAQFALVDEVADALLSDDHAALTRLAGHPDLRVPDTITTWVRRERRAEVRLT